MRYRMGGSGKHNALRSSVETEAPSKIWQDFRYSTASMRAYAPGLGRTANSWQRGHWRTLSPLAGPAGAQLEWVVPVLVG